jgi:ubiquinone/menaquinone biosynthesis C-methylase UbiE
MKPNEENREYLQSWDSYWRDVSAAPGGPFWDSAPKDAVERDLPAFKDAMDPSLVIIDVGCGNGCQTRSLASHFPRVMGVDISPEVIKDAPQFNGAPNLEYRTYDLLDTSATEALHAEIGDANLYVRVVLHQLAPADREQAIRNLSILLGARGRAYVVELSPAADELFGTLIQKYGEPPPKLAKVFSHKIVPATLSAGEIVERFRSVGFEPRSTGTTSVVTTQQLPTGEVIEVPCDCWLFTRAGQ